MLLPARQLAYPAYASDYSYFKGSKALKKLMAYKLMFSAQLAHEPALASLST